MEVLPVLLPKPWGLNCWTHNTLLFAFPKDIFWHLSVLWEAFLCSRCVMVTLDLKDPFLNCLQLVSLMRLQTISIMTVSMSLVASSSTTEVGSSDSSSFPFPLLPGNAIWRILSDVIVLGEDYLTSSSNGENVADPTDVVDDKSDWYLGGSAASWPSCRSQRRKQLATPHDHFCCTRRPTSDDSLEVGQLAEWNLPNSGLRASHDGWTWALKGRQGGKVSSMKALLCKGYESKARPCVARSQFQ